jgi:hypothetical protein
MAWLDIKEAIIEMLEDEDFVVANNRKISRDIDAYMIVVSQDEENNDIDSNYVGVTKYRNRRNFSLYCYHKKTTSNVDLDIVRESVKDELEATLEAVKTLFGTVYNAAGDAGAQQFRYVGMEFEDVETEGIYAPVRMNINFMVEFLQNRS